MLRFRKWYQNGYTKDENPIMFENMDFSMKEGFNTLSVNLSYLIPHKGTKKVCFSSAVANEGKTTIAVNTAIALAKSGMKVLICDMDLRRPRIHKHFGVNRKVGLTDALCFLKKPEEVVKHTKYEGLDVVTAGNISPNPVKLLSSLNQFDVFSAFDDKYDWIIIDTPPVNVVSDLLILLPYSEGVVLVVDQQLSHPVLNRALTTIKEVNGNILGFVMNRADERVYSYQSRYATGYNGKKYGYRYGYRYGYKYGYKYGYSYGYSDEERQKKELEEEKEDNK